MTADFSSRRTEAGIERPDRAVIDIGSNTVRLVIYSGPKRAPEVWLNEKVTAKLGRDLSATGRMPDRAMDMALAALARFAAILADVGVATVDAVATAAVRDAANGGAFLDRVRALGLEPRLLSGAEEAETSAMGVIGAFPGVQGTVADLGGGSLELVQIGAGQCSHAASLPLGTLRLPMLRAEGPGAFRKAVAKELGRADWASAHPAPLYMVGGTWRALANYAMRKAKHPLTDSHGFTLSLEEADVLARKVARMKPETLAAVQGVSSSRAAGLPDAAALLRIMLAELQPERLVFSSWGLREGLLFSRLTPDIRDQDPLMAGIANFTAPRGGSVTQATMIAAWTTDVTSSGPAIGNGGNERLRLAAIMLSLAAARLEPNLRGRHAYDWAMDKRWMGLPPRGRAMVAAALMAACGKPEPRSELYRLASAEELRAAAGWGLAARLCRRLGAGSRLSLLTTSLKVEGERLVLWFDETRAQLVSDIIRNDLKLLAQWLGLEPELKIAAPEAARKSHSLSI